MEATMDIRKATLWDSILITHYWKEMRIEMGYNEEELDLERFFYSLVATMENEVYATYVALGKDNAIIGVIGGEIGKFDFSTKLTGYCHYLYIKKEYRGKGFKNKLVNELHEDFKAKGMEEASFGVKYDAKVVKVWERSGYIPVNIKLKKEIK